MTIDLAALEALIAKATPGPWECDDKQVGDAYRYILGRVSLIARIPTFAGGEDNAALIVAAVNALPELIARVRELERERDQNILNRACADALVSAAKDMTQAAALAMRERCAEVCEERGIIYDGLESDASTRYFADKMRGARTAAGECAAAIREIEP